MRGWPPVRTVRDTMPSPWHFLAAAASSFVLPVPLGVALLAQTKAVLDNPVASAAGTMLSATGFFLAFSFYLSWIAILIATPLAILAFRRGLAGWLVALGAGLAITGALGAFVGIEARLLLPAGAICALIYWLTLRLLAPQAFGARTRPRFTPH